MDFANTRAETARSVASLVALINGAAWLWLAWSSGRTQVRLQALGDPSASLFAPSVLISALGGLAGLLAAGWLIRMGRYGIALALAALLLLCAAFLVLVGSVAAGG